MALLFYTSLLRFAMMQHRGEILENAIRQSGIPLTRIVKNLNKSRRWLYNQFSRQDVSLDVFLEIGKLIHHDFSKNLNEFKPNTRQNHLIEDANDAVYGNQSAQYWKDKYMHLLEEYNELLKSQNLNLKNKS
jgi:hypothetical protein